MGNGDAATEEPASAASAGAQGEGGVERLDPAALGLWRAQGALGLVAAAAAITIAEAVLRLGRDLPGWPGIPALLILVVGGIILMSTTRAAFDRWQIVLGDDALELHHGILVHRRSLIPWYRVQHIDVGAGPLTRAFGLSYLVVHTASAATDAEIRGVREERAEVLRRLILERSGNRDGV